MFVDSKISGKLTVVVAGLLLLAASGIVWSKSRSAGADVRAAAASAISPMDLMLNHKAKLPVENWDSF